MLCVILIETLVFFCGVLVVYLFIFVCVVLLLMRPYVLGSVL